MPLDKVKGEPIDGMPDDYIVVNISKWRNTPLMPQAAEAAADAFIAIGALLPVWFEEDDILVQEYPRSGQIAFLFQRRIRGETHYYPYVYELPKAAIKELVAEGLWTPPTEH